MLSFACRRSAHPVHCRAPPRVASCRAMNKPVVFIHTNEQHLLGVIVSAYSFRRQSRQPERFEVRLLRLEETPQLCIAARANATCAWARWPPGTTTTCNPSARCGAWCRSWNGLSGARRGRRSRRLRGRRDVIELFTSDMGGKAVIWRDLPPKGWPRRLLRLERPAARLRQAEALACDSRSTTCSPASSTTRTGSSSPTSRGAASATCRRWNDFDRLTAAPRCCT